MLALGACSWAHALGACMGLCTAVLAGMSGITTSHAAVHFKWGPQLGAHCTTQRCCKPSTHGTACLRLQGAAVGMRACPAAHTGPAAVPDQRRACL
jgi:hypothetical protein